MYQILLGFLNSFNLEEEDKRQKAKVSTAITERHVHLKP